MLRFHCQVSLSILVDCQSTNLSSLPSHFDDAKLELEVTKVFHAFGTVFVKIKRDRNHIPFAFAQYTVG